MKKVAIFLINIFQFGGIERVVSILANSLVKTGKYEVELISLFKTAEKPKFTLDDRIMITNIFETPMNFKINIIKVLYHCRKLAKNKEIDVLITAGMEYVPITWFSFRKVKHIAWEHINITIGKKIGMMRFGRKIAYNYSDEIVVLTKRDLKNYQNYFSKKRNLNQIYNPYEFVENKTEYKADSKKIVSSGRFTSQKGFDMLIDVAKLVFSNYNDWQWDVYGDGEDRPLLEAKIADNNLEGRVILKGFVKDMEKNYPDYSLYVMTSRHEGYPMTLIEAHSYKLPIVSFDCNCGPDELIIHGVNGYLVECFDIKKMADRICEMIEDRDKRVLFSSMTNLDKEKLDISVFTKSWENLIDM